MTRLEKYDIFKQFFSGSKNLFEDISKNYKPHLDLRNSHGFYVFPGSRNGGQDTTAVDVVFGLRSYRISKKIKGMQTTTETDIAYGASLIYHQIDNGNILVNLHPAYTDSHKAQEQFIIIDYITNTKKLLDEKYITRHYKYLVSYLVVTSIENKPNLIDKARIFYLRMTKRYYNNKITHEPRINKYAADAFKLILTVGFSGFLLTFIPFFANQNKNKEFEKRIEILIENQNRIIEILHTINLNNDAENYTLQLEEIKIEIDKLNEILSKSIEQKK